MSSPFAPPVSTQAPPPVTDAGELASRGSRLAAAVLDRMIKWSPMVAIGMLPSAAAHTPHLDPSTMGLFGLGLLGYLLVVLYNWWLLSTRGQSLMKRAVGIRIVRVDGSDVNFLHAVVLRQWVPGAFWLFASCFSLGFFVTPAEVLSIFGVDRRCVHDHLADTKVVVARTGWWHPKRHD